jgi:hypothetical protein
MAKCPSASIIARKADCTRFSTASFLAMWWRYSINKDVPQNSCNNQEQDKANEWRCAAEILDKRKSMIPRTERSTVEGIHGWALGLNGLVN